jgi:hypothetical protein
MGAWYEGAIHVRGANASYESGRNLMDVVVLHYTVGVNSYPVGVRGYFQFLINRDGTIYQFAPVDAVCWHAGEWNRQGPGIEVEYHYLYHGEEVFNPAMREAARGLIAWLRDVHGIRSEKWPGDRIPTSYGWRGAIDHTDLVQSAMHFDYWPATDWAVIAGWTPPIITDHEEDMILLQNTDNGEWFLVNTTTGWNQRGLNPLTVIKLAEKVPYALLPGLELMRWVEDAKAAFRANAAA